ncbi:MAG: hypothetical protein ACE5GC_06600, partial [Acidimicrobiia bacterium]
ALRLGSDGQRLLLTDPDAPATNLLLAAPVSISLGPRGWSVEDAAGFQPQVGVLEPITLRQIDEDESVLALDDERYPGFFSLTPRTDLKPGAVDVVNHVMLESYLPGVVAGASALVPYRALKEISRSIADAKIALSLGEREARFSSDRGSMTVRIIEATFPNYRQLLPDSYPNRLVVDRSALLDAIGRASLVAEDHIPVRLSLHEGGVELSVTRQEVGEETEHLAGVYEGEDMTIAYNTRYLTDGVTAVSTDDVVLQTSDPLKPGLLTGSSGSEFRYLLMPVRL